MGSALLSAIGKKEYAELLVFDKDIKKANEVAYRVGAHVAPVEKIAEKCDYIFLAVKPNIIPSVAEEIAETVKARGSSVTVVSMAAGVDLWSLHRDFGSEDVPVIRIMPNTPVSVGRGMILWCADDNVAKNRKDEFVSLLSEAGELDSIPERLIDAASALSGCGPAFVFMFAEALADGAVVCGLPRDKAKSYAAETLIGAAELLKSSGRHPGELKDAVCSPGGSTIAGVMALEDGAFRSSVMNAVISAYERTLELGK